VSVHLKQEKSGKGQKNALRRKLLLIVLNIILLNSKKQFKELKFRS